MKEVGQLLVIRHNEGNFVVMGEVVPAKRQQLKTAFKEWLETKGVTPYKYQVIKVKTGEVQVTKIEQLVIKGL